MSADPVRCRVGCFTSRLTCAGLFSESLVWLAGPLAPPADQHKHVADNKMISCCLHGWNLSTEGLEKGVAGAS